MRLLLKIILILSFGLIIIPSFAQVRLKNRIISPENNTASFSYSAWASRNTDFPGKIFCILQFNSTVTESQKQQLAASGISLFHYIPDNAFTAVINQPVAGTMLEKLQVNSIFELTIQDKLSERLQKKDIPTWAIKEAGTIDVIVHFSKGIDATAAEYYFLHRNYQVIDNSWRNYHFLTLRISQQALDELAAISFVEFIEPVVPDPKTLNNLVRANTRANVLNAPVSSGGEGLSGKGVTIGIGDDADPSDHVDLEDRVINRAAGPQQTHGTHVAGITAGGGLKDPLFQGVAPQATIIAQLFNGIFLNAAAYIADYRMVVTNNSWGNITGECDLTGVYDTYSKLMDDHAVQYPFLLHVFAAGNDGPLSCQGFPQQYHTIVSGHQSAKNVLSVGWAEKNMTVSTQSSMGPTADGRMKPEITSQGSGVRSTAPNDEYFTDWGTSMAAPSVAGGAALLIEKYRQLNSGADPKSGLIKALLMNGARDIENPAPDHKSGYGFLHLLRSLDMLKKGRYLNAVVSNGNINDHTIVVPAGSAQLKVMVYWHDPSAAIFAQKALVNDIDLEVITPSSATVLPWRLNSDSNNSTVPAIRAADHLNNSEQVTFDDPVAGTYTIKVKGTAINSGAQQEYFLVYDILPTGLDLTYPSAGEALVPGETIVINWDAWGGPNNAFTLEYSTNNGASWNSINASIPANARQYTWTVPQVVSQYAKIRLTRNATSQTDESQPFVLVSQPAVYLTPVQCEGYINLQWDPVFGATDYEVMMKQGTEMTGVTTTPSTSYIFSGLHKDSVYWVTIRPRINGNPGRRSLAVKRKPENGTCTGSISDNDLKLDSIVSPVTGRKFTSTEITTNAVSIRIKNLDDAPVTGFTIQYSMNGSPYLTQNFSATIPAGSTVVYPINGFDFSNPGDYNFTAVVKNNLPDGNPANDTFRMIIRQLPNPPVTLPFAETFEAAPVFDITKDITGLPGLDRWDFANSTDTGRIRSFINTGIAKTGNRAMSLDAKQFTLAGNTNYLTGTFNLSNYSSISPADIGLKIEFAYKHHGQQSHQDNKVWIRKTDTDPWLEIYNLDSMELRAGEWKTVSIHLAPTLTAHTTNFQVRFGQHGNYPIGDNISNDGITIDDVKLSASAYDIELVELLSPPAQSCGQGSAFPVTIKYLDHHGVSGCIPVKYRLDNGAVIAECMMATGTFSFNTKLSVPSTGSHLLEVWTDHPSDTYRSNDTTRTTFYVNAVINKFPYIENFENGQGNWHTEGYLSSWEYGTPASLKIRSAASGNKAWKTKLTGQYNENEWSYLYSPCFNITDLSSPFLSFNVALDIEQCGVFVCDKLWLEYSSDGKSWNKLGSYGQGINWYNNKNEHVWDSANYTQWHIAGIAIPPGLNTVQFRFVLQSDAGVTREGVAIDDVQVFDKTISADPQWIVYPNPFSSFLQVTSVHEAGSRVSLQLFDATGRKILQQAFTATGFAEQHIIKTAVLPTGMYVLKISDGRFTKNFKLVRQ